MVSTAKRFRCSEASVMLQTTALLPRHHAISLRCAPLPNGSRSKLHRVDDEKLDSQVARRGIDTFRRRNSYLNPLREPPQTSESNCIDLKACNTREETLD